MEAVKLMYEIGVFEVKYKGIVEIHPLKCFNHYTLDLALKELSKTHELVKMTNNWIRAFEK